MYAPDLSTTTALQLEAIFFGVSGAVDFWGK